MAVKIRLDPEKVKALAAEGLSQTEIAKALGVSRDTVMARKQDTPAIAQALEEGYAQTVEKVENTLYKLAVSGQCVAATIYYLKCRAPERWSDKQRVDITQGGSPVQLQIINDLKD